MTEIRCPLAVAAREHPDQPALIDDCRAVTYAEYDARVREAVERLKTAGVVPGERIGLLGTPSVEYIIALMAIIHLGAIACPLSTRAPSSAILTMIATAGIHRLLVQPDGRETGWELPAADIGSLVSFSEPPALTQPLSQIPLCRFQYATVIFTSGSSGTPKAALHSFANHYYSALGSNENIQLQPGDRWLLALPLYHVSGLSILFRTMLAGAAAVIALEGDDLADTVETLKITHCSLVSTQLARLLDTGRALPSLKAALVGGSAVSPQLIQRAKAASLPIHTSFGLTEMASQVTTTAPGDSLERLLTSGSVLPHRRLKIAPDGEILVAGETLFCGYLYSDRIDHAIDDDGWFHTRDVGEIDGQDCLRVCGRIDNMFVSGGENIHPEVIERALLGFVDFDEVVVVPAPDPEFGQTPCAFIRLKTDHKLRGTSRGREVNVATSSFARMIERQMEKVLPRFMIPKRYRRMPDDVPRTGIKVDRDYLRRLVAERREL